MRVGIIGHGDLARSLGHRLRAAGYDVVGVDDRDDDREDRVAAADVVLLAMPRPRSEPAFGALRGKIVADNDGRGAGCAGRQGRGDPRS